MHGAGRGAAVIGSVTEDARSALAQVAVAQSALASAQYDESEQAFTAATRDLEAARLELNDALASSRIILGYLDISGRVRSGDALLAAATELSRAGELLTRTLPLLLDVQVLPEGDASQTVVDALEVSHEDLVAAHAALASAADHLETVDAEVLPAEAATAIEPLGVAVPRARDALGSYLEQSDSILELLGANQERHYLMLFQNNHELRPTGGFIGSLALVSVNRGAVEEIDISSVYDPDGQLKEFIAPPPPLLPIVDRWFLRDANWFVDYEVSARKIAGFFEKEGGPTVDGVIAVTPDVITDLLDITGPVDVPEYDISLSAENFVTETQDLVTYSYDRELNRPKQFLADFAPVLFSRLLNSAETPPSEVLGALARNLSEKQLLVFFRDEAAQAQIRNKGWGGQWLGESDNFLAVNNANIGGHKSDQFVEQEIDVRSTLADTGDVEVVVTIRRTHHGPTEASTNDDLPENPAFIDNTVWQRVLVPEGAELLEAQGYTPASEIRQIHDSDESLPLGVDAELLEWQRQQTRHRSGTTVGHEAGKAYFANWVVTRPGATTVTLYRYRLPNGVDLPTRFDPAEGYQLYLGKQPGDTRTSVRAELTLPEGIRIVHTSPEAGMTRSDDRTAVYRGELTTDRLIGVVYERE